jgi:hypothetical protein
MRKKTTYNPQLLKEELNRFKMLESYSFYTGKQEMPEYDEKKDDLILGSELDEAEEEVSPDATADDIANELGIDDTQGGEATPETPTDDMGGDVTPAPEAAPAMEEPAMEEPASDDVEVDVTELVKGSEEAKMAADRASQNSEMLLQKLSDLESRVASMDNVSSKIAELEQEIIKRNPTPVEKLEMRSLSSFPYSQKLTDYWADKKGAYDVMGDEKEDEEYTLTQDDVDSSYSEGDIKQSFTVKDDYEEEDI